MYFTQIPEYIQSRKTDSETRRFQSKLASVLTDVVLYVSNHFTPTIKYKKSVVSLINTISYYYVSGDSLPLQWDSSDPFSDIEVLDADVYEDFLGPLMIYDTDVTWDIQPNEIEVRASTSESSESEAKKLDKKPTTIKQAKKLARSSVVYNSSPKSKREDISFEFPKYPSVDTNQIWAIGKDYASRPVPIFVTLPKIPTKQCEISMTTSVDLLSETELLNLYPDTILHPRRPEMYQKIDGFGFDDTLGFIPRIEGFSEEDIRNNIIQYPQFNYLFRYIGEDRVSFLKHIEIDGELYTIQDACNVVDDLKNLPAARCYVWDYIVRRYLLERDIKHIQHRYPMVGSFDPFMTLFMPKESYSSLGYNTLELARSCIRGRVNFYISRNPLVRELIDIEQ